MKNFFFGILVLALFLVGCDGGTFDANDADPASKSDATSISRIDAVPPGPASCVVPQSKMRLGVQGMKPKGGYRLETYPIECSVSVSGPTDCSDPVDGFANGNGSSAFCCVADLGRLVCTTSMFSAFGNVALCSSSGVFVGWACSQ